MRWPVTAADGTSIREAMAQIDRAGSGGIVAVDDEGRLVGTATAERLRRTLRAGVAVDAPLSAVVDDSGAHEAANSERPSDDPGTPLEHATDRSGPDAVPDGDADGSVIDATATIDGEERSRETGPESTAVETVLVVGGAGYLGSVLCRRLLEDGFSVRALDPLLYGESGVADLLDRDRFTLRRGDARSVETVVDAIEGVDAVVHLGGIVGDPASELDPRKTLEYNYHSTRLLASICKYYQINRFVFASTCSVYGRAATESGRCTEESALNPVSLYARVKIQSERALRDLADGNFSPTILRMATIYGRSPRMRFDLVGNILPAKAYHEGVVPVFGGDQYRPNVHVADAARAYVECLTAPIEDVGDTVLNVGSNRQNYRIDELATIVSDCIPGAEIEYHDDRTDDRSYRVSFDRIGDAIGFEPDLTVRDHCQELEAAFEAGEFDDYTADRYDNRATLEGRDEFEERTAAPDHYEPPARDPLPSNGV